MRREPLSARTPRREKGVGYASSDWHRMKEL